MNHVPQCPLRFRGRRRCRRGACPSPRPRRPHRTDGGGGGGNAATIAGGGDNLTILYSGTGAGGGALQAQAPRLARARNGYGGVSVEYMEPETAAAGREAWMVGGGENAQVVYSPPR